MCSHTELVCRAVYTEQKAARGRNLRAPLGKAEQEPGGAAHLLTSQQQGSLQAVWQQAGEHQHGQHCDCPSSSSQALLMHRLSYTGWEAVPGLSFPEKSHLSSAHCWSAFLGSISFKPGLVPASWEPAECTMWWGSCGFKAPRHSRVYISCFLGVFCKTCCEKTLSPYSQMDYRKWRCLASSTNPK